MDKADYEITDPRYLAADLYTKFDQFGVLNDTQVRKCCEIALKEMMKEATPHRRLEYDMARIHLRNKNV